MRVDYENLAKTIDALIATVVAEVHHSDDRFDWTGFYRVTGPEMLKIGPFQGRHGYLTIPFSRGVCGAAARTGQAQIVDDVEAFAGHIACAASTRSELVVPVRNAQGTLIGVFDIDSNRPAAFTHEDAQGLSSILAGVFGIG